MAYQNAWTFRFNVAPVDTSSATGLQRSFLFQLKDFLVSSGGWTVISSSNGVSVTSGDSWFSASALNSAASAYSWVVLKSPVGLVAGLDGSYTGNQSCLYVVLGTAYVGASLSNQIEISFHCTQPTGSTISTYPTSTSVVRTYNGITNTSAPGSLPILYTGNASSMLWHFACTSRGHFYAMHGSLGLGGIPGFLGVLPMSPRFIQSLNKDYPFAVAIAVTYIGNNSGAPTISYLGGPTGWAYDGSACSISWAALATWTGGVYQPVGGVLSSSGGVLDGEHEYSQITLYSTNVGRAARIGVIQDFYLSGQGTSQMSTDVPSPNMSMIRIGNLWVPANSVPQV